jgi:hypothetical protein
MRKAISSAILLIASLVVLIVFYTVFLNFSVKEQPTASRIVQQIKPSVTANLSCPTNIIEVSITNLDTQASIDTKGLVFYLDGSIVECKGLEIIIEPNQTANCTITGFLTFRYHVVGITSDKLFSASFSCEQFISEPVRFPSSVANIEEEMRKQYNLTEFKSWAEEREIALVGVIKNSNEIYYQGLNITNESIGLENINYWWEAEKGLRKIPDKILQIMKGSTIYFSNKTGRGYTMPTAFIKGTTAGFILEQIITERQAVHEFGHILDSVIKGTADYKDDELHKLDNERKRLFEVTEPYNPNATKVPAGFINIYSSANDQENFAEHFAYYILYPDIFREKMKGDPLLKEKYEFFKKWIFDGKEY